MLKHFLICESIVSNIVEYEEEDEVLPFLPLLLLLLILLRLLMSITSLGFSFVIVSNVFFAASNLSSVEFNWYMLLVSTC